MDPLTHALSGALLVRAAISPQSKSRALPLRNALIAGFAAAAFPDIDIALRLIDTLTYLNWHQGPTHSLVLLPLWAFLLAHVFSLITRGRYAWQCFYFPVCLGITIHIAGDVITSYGLMLFSPFSTERFSVPLAFVIDLWFSGIIVLGLILSGLFAWGRMMAAGALICLGMYGLFLASLHQQANRIGEAYAREMALISAEINVLPQPFSPYNWKIIVTQEDTYHIAWINLGSSPWIAAIDAGLLSRMAATYRPSLFAEWQQLKRFGATAADELLAREAWHQSALTDFRRFAVFPQMERIDYSDKGICVWFYDLRFQFPYLPPSFRYGGCKNEGADWFLQRQRGTFWID
ncbi:inner membrane protein [Nitrosomonas nitrosa]|uniref:Inner membrane protein n=1 Tax=Nitrosomonas nitrosa TaxID=52442 RepID=A0A1I4LCV9_9PROT|nr:metal-dependent hydrolase [Nitrosomonas nitrosa]SFL88771.1 inner membrane protein [Nitrosomonas nitrosa]